MIINIKRTQKTKDKTESVLSLRDHIGAKQSLIRSPRSLPSLAMTILYISFSVVLSLFVSVSSAFAIVDPLAVTNNKFGIHLIHPTKDETSPAAELINSSGGDWGYVTVLIESKDKSKDKWQDFFNELRRRHLVPIVRIASSPEGSNWKVPNDGEEEAWADFLNSLNWPVKNRYVTIYNEPNQGQEWGGSVDPASYAKILDKTITALKKRSDEFFVLNAGFDASAPEQAPKFKDEVNFLIAMDEAVPGIFNRLDGWVSHSYPNPGFVGSPNGVGRGTVRTWYWELQTLRSLGLNKYLPVFITETGWKHAEGKKYDSSLPTADEVAQYYKQAFLNAWNSNQIVAITPFIFSYQDVPFDHFSFKKLDGTVEKNANLLGVSTDTNINSPFYPQFHIVKDLPKVIGTPTQKNISEITKGGIFSTLVAGETYKIPLTFKNTGQAIWNDGKPTELIISKEDSEITIETTNLNPTKKIEPGESLDFEVLIKNIPNKEIINLQLKLGDSTFDFSSKVKTPVSLFIKGILGWKEDPSGEYLLSINSSVNNTLTSVKLDKDGSSGKIEARYLLPDYEFDFTLSRPYYKSKTIHQKVTSGDNNLDFGKLDPDIIGTIFNPVELWRLLPFNSK